MYFEQNVMWLNEYSTHCKIDERELQSVQQQLCLLFKAFDDSLTICVHFMMARSTRCWVSNRLRCLESQQLREIDKSMSEKLLPWKLLRLWCLTTTSSTAPPFVTSGMNLSREIFINSINNMRVFSAGSGIIYYREIHEPKGRNNYNSLREKSINKGKSFNQLRFRLQRGV